MLYDMHGNLMKFASGLGRLRESYWIQSGLLGSRDSPVLSATAQRHMVRLPSRTVLAILGHGRIACIAHLAMSSASDRISFTEDSPSRQP
jgi:hypothetical protein